MTTSAPTATELRANQDHAGINVAIMLLLIALVVGLFLTLLRLLPNWLGGYASDYWIISTIVSLLIGAGIVALLDPFLKQAWPSGHLVTFSDDQITHVKPDKTRTTIDLTQDHTNLFWHHSMRGYARYGRERQLRNGTFCVACQFQQGDETLVVQAFLAPRQFFWVEKRVEFHELNMEQLYDLSLSGRMRQWSNPGNRPTLPPELIVSNEGVYWLAERNRWGHNVAELTAKDFVQLIEFLQFR